MESFCYLHLSVDTWDWKLLKLQRRHYKGRPWTQQRRSGTAHGDKTREHTATSAGIPTSHHRWDKDRLCRWGKAELTNSARMSLPSFSLSVFVSLCGGWSRWQKQNKIRRRVSVSSFVLFFFPVRLETKLKPHSSALCECVRLSSLCELLTLSRAEL